MAESKVLFVCSRCLFEAMYKNELERLRDLLGLPGDTYSPRLCYLSQRDRRPQENQVLQEVDRKCDRPAHSTRIVAECSDDIGVTHQLGLLELALGVRDFRVLELLLGSKCAPLTPPGCKYVGYYPDSLCCSAEEKWSRQTRNRWEFGPHWFALLLETQSHAFQLLVRRGAVNFNELEQNMRGDYESHILYFIERKTSYVEVDLINEDALNTLVWAGNDLNLGCDRNSTGGIDPEKVLHPLDFDGAINLKLLDWLIENGLCNFDQRHSIIHDLTNNNLPDEYSYHWQKYWRVPDYESSSLFYQASSELQNIQQISEYCDQVELRLVLLVQLSFFDTLRVENGQSVIVEWRRVVKNTEGDPETVEAFWTSIREMILDRRGRCSESLQNTPVPVAFSGFLSRISLENTGPKSLQELTRIAIRVTFGGFRFRIRAESLPTKPRLIKFIIRSTLF